jgi:hypothetical protein
MVTGAQPSQKFSPHNVQVFCSDDDQNYRPVPKFMRTALIAKYLNYALLSFGQQHFAHTESHCKVNLSLFCASVMQE